MSDCPLVFVEWEDSAQPISNWQFLADYEPHPTVKCVTVGWLVYDGDDKKGIAQNMGDLKNNAQVSGVIHIPARCITNLVQLEEPALTSFCGDPSSSHPVKEQTRLAT